MSYLQDKGIADSIVKASDMHSVLQELETREKGVDLCILMDGTGSMVSIHTWSTSYIVILYTVYSCDCSCIMLVRLTNTDCMLVIR